MRRLALLALVFLTCTALWAQTPAPPQTLESVVEELAGIRSELGSIAELLAALERHQQDATLMARMRMKQERVGELEGELRSMREQATAMEEELSHFEAFESSLDQELEDTDPAAVENAREQLRFLNTRRAQLEGKLEELRLRTPELENELARARAELEDLEELLDERLGLD